MGASKDANISWRVVVIGEEELYLEPEGIPGKEVEVEDEDVEKREEVKKEEREGKEEKETEEKE